MNSGKHRKKWQSAHTRQCPNSCHRWWGRISSFRPCCLSNSRPAGVVFQPAVCCVTPQQQRRFSAHSRLDSMCKMLCGPADIHAACASRRAKLWQDAVVSELTRRLAISTYTGFSRLLGCSPSCHNLAPIYAPTRLELVPPCSIASCRKCFVRMPRQESLLGEEGGRIAPAAAHPASSCPPAA
jgi:hypothetical protein